MNALYSNNQKIEQMVEKARNLRAKQLTGKASARDTAELRQLQTRLTIHFKTASKDLAYRRKFHNRIKRSPDYEAAVMFEVEQVKALIAQAYHPQTLLETFRGIMHHGTEPQKEAWLTVGLEELQNKEALPYAQLRREIVQAKKEAQPQAPVEVMEFAKEAKELMELAIAAKNTYMNVAGAEPWRFESAVGTCLKVDLDGYGAQVSFGEPPKDYEPLAQKAMDELAEQFYTRVLAIDDELFESYDTAKATEREDIKQALIALGYEGRGSNL